MRICIVTDGLPPHCGGLPLIAYDRARGLRLVEGVDVILIAWIFRGPQNLKDESYPSYVHPIELRFPELGAVWKPWRSVKLALFLVLLSIRLASLLFRMRHDFDLLYAAGASSWSSLLSIPIAKMLRKPVVLEMALLGDDDPLSLNRRSKSPSQQIFPHRPLKYTLFLKADAYVSISRGLSEAYRQSGLPESRLFQIPYGLDVAHFKPPTSQAKREVRRKLGLEQESNIILFVGRITSTKGVRQLIAAFDQIKVSYPKTKLLIVGPNIPPDPNYVQAIKKDIEELDLSAKVKLIGIDKMVDNVAEYMQASDIFCLPSEREGLGLVNIEAMASGLPVVVSRLEGVTTEFIQSGHDGFLVPVGDIKCLTDTIEQLLEDGPLRYRIGAAARKRVIDNFSLATYYERHLNLYELLLTGRSKSNNRI